MEIQLIFNHFEFILGEVKSLADQVNILVLHFELFTIQVTYFNVFFAI